MSLTRTESPSFKLDISEVLKEKAYSAYPFVLFVTLLVFSSEEHEKNNIPISRNIGVRSNSFIIHNNNLNFAAT